MYQVNDQGMVLEHVEDGEDGTQDNSEQIPNGSKKTTPKAPSSTGGSGKGDQCTSGGCDCKGECCREKGR